MTLFEAEEVGKAIPAAGIVTDKNNLLRNIVVNAQNRPNDFQTPAYALDPLLPYLKREWRIWEPACGKRNIVRTLEGAGYDVTGSDLLTGYDFLNPACDPVQFDCIVTNPPYTHKNEFLARCYEIAKPFALLMPLGALESEKRQALYRRNGVELILMPYRVDFETPDQVEKSSAWFATAWFCWNLTGRELLFSGPKGKAIAAETACGDLFAESE